MPAVDILLCIGLIAASLYWTGALVAIWQRGSRVPAVRTDAACPEPAPLVSVILPARNEEANLAACLTCLTGQDYPNLEIIVIDDRSEDRTGDIARSFAARDERVRVLDGAELPAGWMGKSWANHQGQQQARGAWLLFTDADTWHHPAGVRGSLALALDHGLDAVTLMFVLLCLSFWEKVILPVFSGLIAVLSPAARVNREGSGKAVAVAAYVLVRRDSYDAVGGHAAIRQQIADGTALARNLKAAGRRIWIVNGRAVLRIRMYTSLPDIWQGWTRNLTINMGSSPGTVAALTVMLLVTSLLPFVALGLSLAGVLPGPTLLALGALACALLLTFQAFGMAYSEVAPLYALLNPLAVLVIVAIALNAARLGRHRQGVAWKGRVYQP